MLFNSHLFILIFLPLCIIGYFTLNHFKKYKLSSIFLLGMSLWFYGYFNIKYLVIMVASILLNYFLYFLMNKINNKKIKKLVLIFGVLINISVLFYFKYMDYFILQINKFFKTNFIALNLILPLGISFFTFQQLSFLIDTYRSETQKYSLLDYANFISFFPQLIAGPIVTHDELIPQLTDKCRKKFNWDNFAKGLYIFVLGLSKKVLIADVFGSAVDAGYDNFQILNATNSLILMFAFPIQLYFDFSGYSDMAIGLAKMMNIDLPLNFNSPFKALTITELWKRWHITLTRFFRKYIYFPLGGNRKGKIRTYINIIIVFLISGIWHGAGLTFAIWGLLHGLFVVITRHFKNFFEKLHPVLNWIITFSFFSITGVFFRASKIKDALKLLASILPCRFTNISTRLSSCFQISIVSKLLKNTVLITEYPNIWIILYFVVAVFIILGSKNSYEKMIKFKPSIVNAITTVLLFIWCIISLGKVNIFLYFNM